MGKGGFRKDDDGAHRSKNRLDHLTNGRGANRAPEIAFSKFGISQYIFIPRVLSQSAHGARDRAE